MAKSSNDERIFPLYFYPTVFVFFLASAVIGAEVFFRYAVPPDRFPAILEGNQELSFQLRKGTTGHFSRKDGSVEVSMSMNSHGLRGNEVEYAKPLNTFRILVLGGSPVFGWALPEEKTLPRLLEKSLSSQQGPAGQKFEVINGGVPGYTPSQSMKYYETELKKYSPDLLVFFLDADLSFVSVNVHTLQKGILMERSVTPYEPSTFCQAFQEDVAFIAFLCEEENRFFPAVKEGVPSVSYTARAAAFEVAIIKKLAALCKENGTKLLVIDSDNVPRSHEEIAAIVTTIPFPSSSKVGNYGKTGYLNESESALIAQKVRTFLQSGYSSENPRVPATDHLSNE